MSNKKKNGVKKEKKGITSPAAASAEEQPTTGRPKPMAAVKPGIFSQSQLTTLILLSMGISRILQVRSAYSGGEKENEAGRTATLICVEHLGEVACTDSTVLSLLKLKFHSALQVALLVSAVAWQCWNNHNTQAAAANVAAVALQQLNALMIIAPMGTGIAAMAYAEVIPLGAVWKQALVVLVLTVLAAPTDASNVPFWGGRRKSSSARTLASTALAGLALANIFRAAHYVMLTRLPNNTTDDDDGAMTLAKMTPFAIDLVYYYQQQLSSAAVAAAAQPILLFMAVDAITCALLYALSWHALPDSSQRAVLLMTSMIKLWEYFYQLPSYADDALFATDALKTTALTTACIAGIGWIAPALFAPSKKKVG